MRGACGHHYINIITFEEAVAELDSHADEIAAALHKADEPDEYAPDCFFTYIVKLSNGKTRIGVASNFNEELERIMDETGLDIVDFHTTPFMSYLDAWHLKEHCKRLFLASDMTGEFYSADFPEVKAALVSPDDKFTKLLSLAKKDLPDVNFCLPDFPRRFFCGLKELLIKRCLVVAD